MEPGAFSTALFDALCDDILHRRLESQLRFGGVQIPPEVSDPRVYAGYALLNSIFKKTELEVDILAEAKTLDSFLAANQACKEWKLDLASYTPDVAFAISEARLLLGEWLEPHSGTDCELNMASIERAARFGPGASVGFGRRPTLYYFKVGDGPHTCTSDFIRSWYELSVRNNPLCESAEMARTARHGRADVRIAGSLAFVPKSYASMRTTVTEPSLNTYFQLGAGEVIADVLKRRVNIDLHTQSVVNSALACAGSKDGSMATVDLKQCSDYISLAMVDYMFPKSAVRWFENLRTPFITTTQGPLLLWMCSTMGNGFTFPLQTILLTAVVLGTYRVLDVKPVMRGNHRNFGVFGDDIAVETRTVNLLFKCLRALGLVVNEEKSYADGCFRESCGADFFDGFPVRGVYVKTYATVQDYFSIYNRLAVWSSRTGVPIPSALKFVLSAIPSNKRGQFVPPDEGVTAGIWSPFPPGLVDQNRWVYNCDIPRPDSFSFEPWYRHPADVFSAPKAYSKWLKKLHELCGGSLNEPAVLKAALYGGVRSGSITPRGEKIRYKCVARMTPRWGYTEQPLLQGFEAKELVRWQLMIDASMA
ncbi:TPA_asm: RNA-directed RNA polymerase [ssRNA phage SRR7976356_1]|uniref:RNA-directed RNA polymerase n=1 Tax=ssRNA phage SRR7976356_1 TaxID=2786732 RepID=A0A8S5L545_9VIRU|nr:RNA-directed RNA polymerase [ssRNA phage SRR7976356_1]DAD52809.1 TPA_asm: RNA-directed RNA polymerase [ssRNA phage SRR7976356_1]